MKTALIQEKYRAGMKDMQANQFKRWLPNMRWISFRPVGLVNSLRLGLDSHKHVPDLTTEYRIERAASTE